MKTAKDLAWKAYVANLPKDQFLVPDIKGCAEIRERFENWWTQNVYNKEHRDSFEPVLSVFIEGKRYIQAE